MYWRLIGDVIGHCSPSRNGIKGGAETEWRSVEQVRAHRGGRGDIGPGDSRKGPGPLECKQEGQACRDKHYMKFPPKMPKNYQLTLK